MAQTYSDCWREVKLYCPSAPVFLVRTWVNTAYKQMARTRSWGFLRGEYDLTISAARSLTTIVATRGSATVTSTAEFLAADAGRQISIGGSFPAYTILTRADANTITLDRVYAGSDVSGTTASILDAYATMPADFGSFRTIADPYNQRRLAFWITEDQLLILDPSRMASDTGPRCLVARAPSTFTSTLGRVQYEYWPRPTTERSYPALYNRQADSLTDTDTLTGVLGDAAEVLICGALAAAAQWPGTSDEKNPYFDLALARAKQAEFLTGVQQLALKDDNHYGDDLATVHWERWPLADLAYNDASLRASDASGADLF